ncbi:MAG TPA: response regulator [Pirellulales bacterium]|nr:response regulator [Pirellulales bacterium]
MDDDPDTCASLSDVLTDLGYRVDVAYDGRSALQLVGENGYAMALLDYQMPGMDGLEHYRRIGQIRPALVGVFVTAFTTSGVSQAALKMGLRSVLSKPINFGELIPLIEEVIGKPEGS